MLTHIPLRTFLPIARSIVYKALSSYSLTEYKIYMPLCKQQWMLKTSVLKLIIYSSLPIFPAIFLLVAYDLFEITLIAKLCSEHLSALSFSAPITIAMTGFTIALSIATNNWICRVKSETSTYSNDNMMGGLNVNVIRALTVVSLFTLFISLLLYMTTPLIYSVLGTTSSPTSAVDLAVTSLATEYTNIRLVSWLPLVLIWQCNGILRSLGHIKPASTVLTLWMLSKFALSYILIGDGTCAQSSNSGIMGAGYGHLISDTCFAFVSLLITFRMLGIDNIVIQKIKWRNTFRQISITGLNATLQQLYMPVCIGVLTYFVASIAHEKLPLLSIVFRIEALALLTPMVFTASLPGILAANWWANEYSRVKSFIINSFAIVFIIQIAIALLLFANAQSIFIALNLSNVLKADLDAFLLFVPISLIGAGFVMLTQSYLNAINHATQANVLSLSHKILFTLPLAIIGLYYLSLTGMFIAIAVANMITAFFAVKRLRQLSQQNHSQRLSTHAKRTLINNPQ